MIMKALKTILAVGVIASGAAFTAASPASAGPSGSIGVYFGGSGGGIYIGNGKRRHGARRHGGNRYYAGGHRRGRNVCTPRRALNKARNLGVNRARIERIGKNRIVVRGFNYGYRAKVVFKRYSRRCQIIKTRGLY